MLVAAGVAFYAMTAIFPAIAAFVSIYALFADPRGVENQAAAVAALLPDASFNLLSDALKAFTLKSSSTLNLALMVSLGVAIWSAKSAVASLMTGLNIVNGTAEKRSFLVQQGVAIALTVGSVAFAAFALSAIALLPAVINILPLTTAAKTMLGLGRWPLLGLIAWFALAVIYRFGPSRENPKWRWITAGAAIASLLWLGASGAFSYYVSAFGSYDAVYGALAAPVVLLLWFWMSALVFLIGAEIDAELAHADGRLARPLPGGAA